MSFALNTNLTQGLYQQSTVQKECIGRKVELGDGRCFRYCKAGEALYPGKNCVAPAATANHVNIAVAANAAIGTKQVKVTVGATAVTEDQYAGGFLAVNDATGEGYQYRIASHPAADASGSFYVQLEDPVMVALVAGTSEVSLLANLWMDVVATTTEESVPVGVAVASIADDSYGWLQTAGQGVYLCSGTPAVGSMLTLSDTEGALEAINATLDVDQPIVAVATQTVGVDGEYKPCWYKID